MRYTEQLLAILQLFNGSRGPVCIDARSETGFGHQRYVFQPPFDELPSSIVECGLQDWACRTSVVTHNAAGIVDLPALVCLWRPLTRFDKSTRWIHAVDPAAQKAIDSAIATMPAPSVLVRAGREQWAAWRLEEPVRHVTTAQELLAQLAARLGGVPPPADLRAFDVPIAGFVRQWNHRAGREHVSVLRAEPARVYQVTDVQQQELTR